MKFCARCDNCRWVCEGHPERPWEGPRACGCGAPGDPCPVCNRADQDIEPEMPEDFVAKGWLELHEGGTFVRFTEAGAALFA
jgi:hypothetical protein